MKKKFSIVETSNGSTPKSLKIGWTDSDSFEGSKKASSCPERTVEKLARVRWMEKVFGGAMRVQEEKAGLGARVSGTVDALQIRRY